MGALIDLRLRGVLMQIIMLQLELGKRIMPYLAWKKASGVVWGPAVDIPGIFAWGHSLCPLIVDSQLSFKEMVQNFTSYEKK